MAVQVQNFSNKRIGQSPIHSMPNISVDCPSWWNSHEQQFPQFQSKSLSLKVGPPPRCCKEEKHVALQPQRHDSSSTQSTGQSHEEATGLGGTSSQDHCVSSNSVEDESYEKRVEHHVKPLSFVGNQNFGVNPLRVDINPSMTHIPYAYTDPYFNGLFTAYGPQIQPQMVGMAPTRVPLPLDLAEDGPIYVNAKQYHGILRRRQMRAKLEAQSKLVKNRRPYLHESRHRHALNRVRGSGGRFLSTKKSNRQPDPTLGTSSHGVSDSVDFWRREERSPEFEVHHSDTGKHEGATGSCSGVTHVINGNGDVIFQQPDHRFSSISAHNISICGTQHRASVVR